MDTKAQLRETFEKYLAGNCGPEEISFLMGHFGTENREFLDGLVFQEFEKLDHDSEILPELPARIYKGIEARIGGAPVKKVSLWSGLGWKIGTAAAVIGLAIGIYFYTARNTNKLPYPELVAGSQGIAPGKNTATLSLAGGKSITLSDAHTGVIIDASQIKYNDGSLVKSASGAHNEMTVTTPRGGTYQITLPDGTKVWLNAASSLTYHMPLKERGGVRKVELSGEAYFEVFRNKLQPFVVNSKKMELTVLGTHFNVNAYNDETNIKATLLEGSVRVRSTAIPPVTLKPNQQAVVKESGIDCILVDPEDAIAWKNGEFKFRSQRIADIMRNVRRWYDVDVIFENNSIAEKTFTADISRYDNISKLLDILQKTGKVKFRIEGRTVYVNE